MRHTNNARCSGSIRHPRRWLSRRVATVLLLTGGIICQVQLWQHLPHLSFGLGVPDPPHDIVSVVFLMGIGTSEDEPLTPDDKSLPGLGQWPCIQQARAARACCLRRGDLYTELRFRTLAARRRGPPSPESYISMRQT